MTTIGAALREARSVIETFDAQTLLAFVLGKNRTYLYTHDTDELPPALLTHFLDCVERCRAGEPVPYITGVQYFMDRAYRVTPDVLIPRYDTETLIEVAADLIKSHGLSSVLDLGTGSGCIACTLALDFPLVSVRATDISEKALNIAQDNARTLQAPVRFSIGAWFDAVDSDERFDLIVSNPPYIHPADEHMPALSFEPVDALTDHVDGLSHYKSIITDAPTFLNKGGYLAFEHGWDQGFSIRELFSEKGLWTDIRTVKDLAERDRVTLAQLC